MIAEIAVNQTCSSRVIVFQTNQTPSNLWSVYRNPVFDHFRDFKTETNSCSRTIADRWTETCKFFDRKTFDLRRQHPRVWGIHVPDCSSLITVPPAFEGAYMFSSTSVQLSPLKSLKRFFLKEPVYWRYHCNEFFISAIDREHFKDKLNY